MRSTDPGNQPAIPRTGYSDMDKACESVWKRPLLRTLNDLSHPPARMPSLRTFIVVNLQVSLRQFQRLDELLEVMLELCSDVERFIQVPVLIVQDRHHVAAFEASRQTNRSRHELTGITQVLKIAPQIRYLRWNPKWIATVTRLGKQSPEILVLAKSDKAERAFGIGEPLADRLSELLFDPNRPCPSIPPCAPTFSASDPKCRDHGRDGSDCTDCIPVRAIDSRLQRALNHPCWNRHPGFPIPLNWDSATERSNV